MRIYMLGLLLLAVTGCARTSLPVAPKVADQAVQAQNVVTNPTLRNRIIEAIEDTGADTWYSIGTITVRSTFMPRQYSFVAEGIEIGDGGSRPIRMRGRYNEDTGWVDRDEVVYLDQKR